MVNRVTLTVEHPLPVYADKPTWSERTKMAQRADAVLQDAEAVLDQFAYYALQGNPRTGSHSSSASAMIFMPARDSLMRAKSLSSTASPNAA